ncbi:hypothetical protein BT96DRAFT_981007 [Gymnopus androsaceus JB14]|uniref:Uncharacterized protein n=1 Tax=Gymnopus androsaceus JB14 TaxID=1447944 RepID=A0A6A4GTP8_9AGAR|nr:hypothetical protein BT96DRAFT_981007 [Gymnopus androsaceus JB14]
MASNITISLADVTTLQQNIIDTAVGMGVWSMNTTLFMMSTYTLIKQGIITSRPRQVLLAMSTLMYIGACASELVYVLNFTSSIQNLGNPLASPKLLEPNARYYCDVVFSRINWILSDGVVCWRAWVLYPLNKIVRGILALCMLGSIAALITTAIFQVELVLNTGGSNGSPISNLSYYVPLLFTNIVATVLVGYKFSIYRREIKVHLISSSRKQTTPVESIFVLLTESGVLYCFFWMLSMISATALSPFSTELLQCTHPQLPSIYLMTVILVVSLQKSTNLHSIFNSQQSQEMTNLNFARPPSSSEQERSFDGTRTGPQIGESFVARVKEASRWKLNTHEEKSQTSASESILEEEIA